MVADASHPTTTPNILVILIDDLGSLTQLFRLGPGHAQHRRTGRERLRFSNFTSRRCARRRGGTADRKESSQRRMRGCRTGAPLSQHAWTDSNHAATMAEVLREYGYTRSRWASGISCRWRTRPRPVRSTSGRCSGVRSLLRIPRRRDDQFAPDLTYDNTASSDQRAGRRLPPQRDLVDHAIGFIHDAKSVRPDRPSSPTSPSARRTRPTRRR